MCGFERGPARFLGFSERLRDTTLDQPAFSRYRLNAEKLIDSKILVQPSSDWTRVALGRQGLRAGARGRAKGWPAREMAQLEAGWFAIGIIREHRPIISTVCASSIPDRQPRT